MLRPTLLKYLLMSTTLVACASTSAVSLAQDARIPNVSGTPEAGETYLSSESLTYNQNTGLIIAEGAVEISQGASVLRADRVQYHENTGQITADGNVVINDPSGNVMFAEQAELTDDLSNGFIQSFRLLMADQSRAAAVSATRTDGTRTDMEYAVYSPCEICADNPTPLWQIKAVKVTHHNDKKQITYQNATLEFLGIPVLYTPFFSHADHTVDRKSGFLVPDAGQSGLFGFWTKIPYYLVLSDTQDATITPYITQEDTPILLAEYRQAFEKADLKLSGSATMQDKNNDLDQTGSDAVFRGHLEVDATYRPNEIWTLGIDAATTSDDTFLRRYDILSDDRLQSRFYAEGLSGRNSMTVEAYHWQGLLDEDDPSETPLALPLLNYLYYTPTSRLGSRWRFNANAAAITSDDIAESYRLTGEAHWRLPYTSSIGDIYTLQAAVRSDLYYVKNKEKSNAQHPEDGFAGRFRPYLSLDWRYPFDKGYGTVRHMIEPFANIFVSPNGGNLDKVPNLDSTTFEFDETNLTDDNRYPGYDIAGGGARTAFGLKTGLYGMNGGYAEAMIGQSFRLTDSLEYPEGSGAEEKSSDFVGRLTIKPHEYLNLETRFRLDGESFEAQRHETDLNAGPDWFRLGFGYTSIAANASLSNTEKREQLASTAHIKITDTWYTTLNNTRDLRDGGRNLDWGWHVGYTDECFDFAVRMRRDYEQDRDIKPNTSISVQIKLKTLG